VQSQGALLGVPGRVGHEDQRVETAAEFALQIRPQVNEGRTLEVFRARLFRVVLSIMASRSGPSCSAYNSTTGSSWTRVMASSKAATSSPRYSGMGNAVTTTLVSDSVLSAGTVRSMGVRSSAQRSERGANLFRKQLRLLPGGEVAALVDFVEIGEGWVGLLDPTARGCDDLARERRESDRD
jgi:hypothetical protein